MSKPFKRVKEWGRALLMELPGKDLKRRLKVLLPYKSWVMVLNEDKFVVWEGWVNDGTSQDYTRSQVVDWIIAGDIHPQPVPDALVQGIVEARLLSIMTNDSNASG